MGRLELLSMTPSLKMVSSVATNRYAAKCPNWQRNCVNVTPPPAQATVLAAMPSSQCWRKGGTAVTVATAFVPDAALSKCWDLAWEQQLQRPRERLCLFVLPVIPLSSSYNEMACQSCLSWEVIHRLHLSPSTSYWNPNTSLGFQLWALISVQIPPILNTKNLSAFSSCIPP